MAHARREFDSEPQPAVQGFRQFVKDHTKPCALKSSLDPNPLESGFLPQTDLHTFFAEGDKRQLKVLLAAVSNPQYTIVDRDAILDNYYKVFGILLYIGKGNFIGHFTTHEGLSDIKLPLRSKPSEWPDVNADFFPLFCQHQWRFCAPTLRYAVNQQWETARILPIIRREQLGGGASAITYKVEVHPSYDNLQRNGISQRAIDPSTNTYVLKSFQAHRANDEYMNELTTFVHLRNTATSEPSLIGFHGSFKQDDTYNIILEYAEAGTLQDFYNQQSPPTNEEDILDFWSNLVCLIRAVKGIHGFIHDGVAYRGWHQDIKPRNILVCHRNGKYTFKLADLGHTHFQNLESGTRGKDTQGTRTYGAPECYYPDHFSRQSRLHITSKVDIWSLGCIFSEAATWLLCGRIGLDQFRRSRINENGINPDFQDSDCFHNGTRVLDCVQNHHEALKDSLPIDSITYRMLDLTKETLLQSNDRPEASNLSVRACNIIAEHRDRLSQTPVQSVADNLSDQHTPHGFPAYMDSEHIRSPHSPFQQQGTVSSSYGLPSPPTTAPDSVSNNFGDPKLAKRFEHARLAHTPLTAGIGSQFPPNSPPHTPTRLPSAMNGMRKPPHVATSLDYDMVRGLSGPSQLAVATDAQTLPGQSIDLRIGGSSDFTITTDATQIDNGLRSSPSSSTPATEVPAEYGSSYAQVRDSGARGLLARSDFTTPSKGSFNGHSKGEGYEPLARNIEGTGHSSLPPPNGPALVHRTQAQRPRRSQQLPVLSFADAFRDARQGRKQHTAHAEHFRALEKRDHLFLLDDSSSMNKHWDELLDVVEVLGFNLEDCDPDGIEIRFTMNSFTSKKRRSKDILTYVRPKRPAWRTPPRLSDMGFTLGEIVKTYRTRLEGTTTLARLKNKVREVRPINIYILTDGMWKPESRAEQTIKSLVLMLEAKQKDENLIGIQFIQFGSESEGTEQLEYLDAQLGLSRDIVDTEPSNGNFWKMLLGSIDKWFDGDDNGPAGGRPSTSSPVNLRSPPS